MSLYGSSTHVTTTCPCWPGWLTWGYVPPATGTHLRVLLHRKYDRDNYNVFLHLFAPRSLTGIEEAPADVDIPKQEEAKGEEEVKEDDETQQQRVDEEVQSLQGSEGRKVGWNKHLLIWNLMWCFHSCCGPFSQSAASIRSDGRESQVQTQMEALGGKMPNPNPQRRKDNTI